MAYIKEYWKDKETREKRAKEHTAYVANKYEKEIDECILNTKTYSSNNNFNFNRKEKASKIVVKDLDSVSAIIEYTKKGVKTAVLNFASYKNPGGMFLNGSRAQEECLCHESFLYNVLEAQASYYAWNNDHKNRAMYTDRALYSPNVIFERDEDTFLCDVITCAAPNFSAAQEYQRVTAKENEIILKKRIEFVLNIAEENNVDVLILGAYGCGVFGQDPKVVARIFKECIDSEKYAFKTVVFAVPDGNENFGVFKNTFK